MLSLKWWNRIGLTSACLPCLIILAHSTSCSSGGPHIRSGIPAEPDQGSFKVVMSSKGGDDAALKEKLTAAAAEIGPSIGCGPAEVDAISWAQSAVSEKLARRYHVKFAKCDLDRSKLEMALLAFQAKEEIESVEADAIVRVIDESDPLKKQQYHLARINRDAACTGAGEAAKAKQVIVAVVDTGVDGNHPDLAPSLLRDQQGRVIGANFVGKGAKGAPDDLWQDTNKHGTHVAGLIGATANNGQGIVGVGSCMPVKIMPIRVLNSQGQGVTLEIERGVQWALAHGADVINLSLGSAAEYSVPPTDQSHPLYDEATEEGVVIFAAAGNNGKRLGQYTGARTFSYDYPASYASVISVAATTESNKLASFSNRGQTVDIAAPGDKVLSTIPGGGYSLLSGTSMASPVAAGAFALALAASRQSSNDRLSAEQVMPILMAARSSSSLDKADVASGAVLDAKVLLDLMKTRMRGTPTPTIPKINIPVPTPTNPTAAPLGLHFVDLSEGLRLRGPVKITVMDWTSAATTRVYLTWNPSGYEQSYPFTFLGEAELKNNNTQLRTTLPYYFYGDGILKAIAVDGAGRVLETAAITLHGL